MHNYYHILNVPQTATYPEIKLAYHSLLLKHHPDKNILSKNLPRQNNNAHTVSNSDSSSPSPSDSISTKLIDIALLKEAYTALSSPLTRSRYDASLRKHQSQIKLGPRPAQIVSLEDFTQLDVEMEDVWEYPCRCGGAYRIFESDMDKGQHLVGCRSCSEVIWVGYEVHEDGEDDGDDADVDERRGV